MNIFTAPASIVYTGRPYQVHSNNRYQPGTTYKPYFPTSTSAPRVEEILTWLPAVLRPNGTLNINQGNIFILQVLYQTLNLLKFPSLHSQH